MLKIIVILEGLKPGILLHNPQTMNNPKTGKKMIPSPKEEAAAGCYWTPDQKSLAYPGTNIHSSLIAASTQWKVGRKNIMPFVAGALEIVPFMIPFNTKKYEIDTRRAIIQRQGILRSRALIFPWQLSFTLLIEDADFPIQGKDLIEALRNIMEEAGRRIGIGDFRPQRKGWFGRFRITEWKIQE